jgi:hypothetical protein
VTNHFPSNRSGGDGWRGRRSEKLHGCYTKRKYNEKKVKVSGKEKEIVWCTVTSVEIHNLTAINVEIATKKWLIDASMIKKKERRNISKLKVNLYLFYHVSVKLTFDYIIVLTKMT